MLTPFFDFNDRFRWMDSFERRMDRILAAQQSREEAPSWLTLRDAGEELVLLADLPGVAERDVEITLENDVLTLRAEARKQKTPEGYKLARAERPSVKILRQIELPVRIDADAVVATMNDGVLELKLPKAREARPRKITVVGPKSPDGASA